MGQCDELTVISTDENAENVEYVNMNEISYSMRMSEINGVCAAAIVKCRRWCVPYSSTE